MPTRKFTGKDFDAIARNSGRRAAATAAVKAGGRKVLGGTRVKLPGADLV